VESRRVALAPYTLATKSTVSATKSIATSCQIQVVANLLSKLATKSTVLATEFTISATVDFVADLLPTDLLSLSATVNSFASVNRALMALIYDTECPYKCTSCSKDSKLKPICSSCEAEFTVAAVSSSCFRKYT